MKDSLERLRNVIKKDPRYSISAYQFVFDALEYTTNLLGKNKYKASVLDRHVTGKQLMDGIKLYALEQFGFMAYAVFEQWGVKQGEDFGNVVFNLVECGLMGKTETDSIEDFKNAYDLKKVFEEEFKFTGKYDIQLSLDSLGIIKKR